MATSPCGALDAPDPPDVLGASEPVAAPDPAGKARWTAADTELVLCCLCHVPGEPVMTVAPFGVVRCPICDLAFVSPRLSAAALQQMYDEPAYFENTVYGDPTGRSPAMALQRTWTAGRLAGLVARRPPPARLLEIGTGYGYFLAAARDAGYDVRGVELSRTGAAHARDRHGLEIFRGQVEAAPSDDAADVICFWDTLEHVPDPLEFLRQVRLRLAEDGVVALSVPSFASPPARVLGTRWWTLKPEQHIWLFTPTTLRLVAARAGLVLTSMVTSPLRRANAGRTDSLVAFGRALPLVDR